MAVCLQNARWSVTDFGLETVTADYEPYRIGRHQLLEVDREGFCPLYVCLIRVSRQIGVNVEAFIDAWSRALKVHAQAIPSVDPRILEDSLREARANTEHYKQQRWNDANHVSFDLPT